MNIVDESNQMLKKLLNKKEHQLRNISFFPTYSKKLLIWIKNTLLH